MRFLKCCSVVLAITVQMITGCGGSGGGGAATIPPVTTTKTATLKFYSQSTNPGDTLSGFDLTVTLPTGSVISTDANGDPLSSAVYLSGNSAGYLFASYDSTLRKLTANSATSSSYTLGEFITILVTVPSSYVPKMSDITYSFTAWGLPAGTPIPTITATGTFI